MDSKPGQPQPFVYEQYNQGQSQGASYSGTRHLVSNKLLNPCANHPFCEIAYFDKTSMVGACEQCRAEHVSQGREMVPIGSAVTELNEMLKNLETSVAELKLAKLKRLEL